MSDQIEHVVHYQHEHTLAHVSMADLGAVSGAHPKSARFLFWREPKLLPELDLLCHWLVGSSAGLTSATWVPRSAHNDWSCGRGWCQCVYPKQYGHRT